MNRKESSTAAAAKPASMKARTTSAAMGALLSGYREEAELYVRMRRLTWRQRDMLRNGMDLSLFREMLDEKEELLRTIAQIESEMKSAKSLVLSYPPAQCPDRRKLEMLLDRLAGTIEEIRIVESHNAGMLESVECRT